MKKYDVVILTDSRYVNPSKKNKYINNVLLEDGLVQKSLEKRGLKTIRLSWDDPLFNWSTTKYVLFRSTWDYFDRFNEFSTWLNTISQQCKLLNSENIIKWNIDKHYLQDLQKNNIYCIPTLFIKSGSDKTLAKLHHEMNWQTTILKPVISGGARHTYKLNSKTISQHETLFKTLIKHEDFMLQPFQKNIIEKGEVSLIIIDGNYTHAVLKTAKKGDFRVQDDYGGTVHEYFPEKQEIDFAEKAIQACPSKPIYARVDICTANNGKLALVELELIEPELWFRNNTKASEKLADAIQKLF